MDAETRARFFAKVNVTGGCWQWTASHNGKGYGSFKVNGRCILSHRMAWQIFFGAIPKGLCVLHKCDNRRCVRPDHLFLGTSYDNVQDMIRKGRDRRMYGADHWQTKLPDADVIRLRERYAAGGVTQKQLASEFHLSVEQVHYIIRFKSRVRVIA